MMGKKKQIIEQKWVVKYDSIPAEPEDHGKVFFNIPFCQRLRFAVNPIPDREPTITVYTDIWDSQTRRWRQHTADAYGLSVLKRLMVLVDEEGED